MVKTIGNPLSWGARAATELGHAVQVAADSIGSHDTAIPELRRLEWQDLRQALNRGLSDFGRCRSDVPVLFLIYPLVALLMAYLAFHRELLPLLFPAAAGLALLGPFAAVGLYEMSRHMERGDPPNWRDAFRTLRPETLGPVMTLGLYLIGLYAVWLYSAAWLFGRTLGPEMPISAMAFLTEIFTTPAGWVMLVVGTGVGALFAAIAMVSSFIALPMLVDRQVGLPVAVITSLRVAQQNRRMVMLWGAIVAGLLALAAVPLFLGMVLVLPILGHATWHLYRAAVVHSEEGLPEVPDIEA